MTFERKVAVQYLAHLLVGDGASELGDGRSVVSVEFQQAPDHPVDDLVVSAAYPDASPSLVLVLAIRRSPKLVLSDESTRKLIRQFVRTVMNAPTDGPEHRLGLVVAGPQPHTQQLETLAGLARVHMDASGFFDLVRTPRKFNAGIRGRLDQLERLVKRALSDVGVTEADTGAVQQHAWKLLSRLAVCMPRLESPDETDWSAVTNSLVHVSRRSDQLGASRLLDRLVALASEYPPRSARVDLKLLRRDAHAVLDPTTRRHQRGWEALDHLRRAALASVRDGITASDGARRVRFDRHTESEELLFKVANAAAVVVSGESDVANAALALLGLTAAAEADPCGVQALCINLRHVPKLTIQLEATLGCPLSALLGELSAPQRMLIVDGLDAIHEGMEDAFRYLLDAAQESDVKVVAVTSADSRKVVRDTLSERFDTEVSEHVVTALSNKSVQPQPRGSESCWSAVPSGTSSHLYGVVWTGKRFTAVGDGGTIVHSADGISWKTVARGITSGYFHAITWNRTRFIAVGLRAIAHSIDGITWTDVAADVPGIMYGVAWNGAYFVAVGDTIMHSRNGITWNATGSLAQRLLAVAWNGTQFVAVGVRGAVVRSADGVSWTAVSSGTSSNLHAIAWNGTRFVSVGDGGTIIYGLDGRVWKHAVTEVPAAVLSGVAWNGRRFVAVGHDGAIVQSVDGITWEVVDNGITMPLHAIAWNGTRFVAIGQPGTIISSSCSENAR